VSVLSDKVRFAWQLATRRARPCEHIDDIQIGPTQAASCPACVAVGDSWRALRVCAICGEIGCCDSSKNKHARAHAKRTGHLLVRCGEPDRDWVWCYADGRLVALEGGSDR
jgi:uncharacterized UBP type Zn finger protein